MEFRNTSAINPQRPEALVEMSSGALMADDGRVAFETHLMNSLSIRFAIRLRVSRALTLREALFDPMEIDMREIRFEWSKNTSEFYLSI